ncbi:coiled-coil domain-containing protein [Lentzea nigeriaca]|uniref:metallopeptidase n=1 Tax=Lentzea nigeriaca TaxID=1128665 RepID=UPI00195C12E2|nr:metallopeptidase [Lentzea nigeriaca]MBM7864427.1 cell division septum initiation protein DivIVA [Lentzea nigeriaca]
MELLPLRTDFDVRWRGYDHDQVQHYVHAVEGELEVLTADRDAALARAESLARQLEAARAENAGLRARVDRISRTPIDPGALTERLRRMVELAHAEAEEITTRARIAAEQDWANAHRAADRLRGRAEHLVAELDRRRADAEAEHRELMDRAHAQVETMTRQAERRRRELDDQAAQIRGQIEADFEQAMTQRRAEAMRALADQQRSAKARADQIVQEATEHAHRIVADAEQRVDLLRRQREHIAEELRAAQALLADMEPLLQPLPEEAVVKMEVIHHDHGRSGVSAADLVPVAGAAR